MKPCACGNQLKLTEQPGTQLTSLYKYGCTTCKEFGGVRLTEQAAVDAWNLFAQVLRP